MNESNDGIQSVFNTGSDSVPLIIVSESSEMDSSDDSRIFFEDSKINEEDIKITDDFKLPEDDIKLAEKEPKLISEDSRMPSESDSYTVQCSPVEPINIPARDLNNSHVAEVDVEKLERCNEIVRRYEAGPSKEDIDTSQYSCPYVNRYGFIISQNYNRHFDERISNEKNSIRRWAVILENWNDYGETNKKVRTLLYEGVPDTYRGQIWKNILSIGRQISENQNLYENLKSVALKRSLDIEQIDKDVERTHRTHIAFHVRYSLKQRELFNVLVTYSLYDSKVRYCQGMNEIAGTLLLYMNEEETFFALKTLLIDEVHNMHGFYAENFPKLTVFENHLEKTLQLIMAPLMNHFLDIGFTPKIVTTKWFLLCFINSIPFSILLKVWDRFILEGSAVMYPVAITIFKYHKNQLMKSSLDQVAQLLNSSDQFRYDSVAFFQKFDSIIRRLKSRKLYPIPGVKHDIIDIDVSSIVQCDVTSTNDINKSCEIDDERRGSIASIQCANVSKDRRVSVSHSFKKSVSLHRGFKLFDPNSIAPPIPLISWKDFSEFAQLHSKEIIRELSFKEDDIKDITKLANFVVHVSNKINKNN